MRWSGREGKEEEEEVVVVEEKHEAVGGRDHALCNEPEVLLKQHEGQLVLSLQGSGSHLKQEHVALAGRSHVTRHTRR